MTSAFLRATLFTLALVTACAPSPPRLPPARAREPASPPGPAPRAPEAAAGAGSAAAPAPVVTRPLFDPDLSEGPWPRGEVAASGFDAAALEAIVAEAEATRSSSLLVVKDGRVVVERYFGAPRGPIETMSMTKSVVSLAIGILLAEEKIPSLDAPMSTWLTGWDKDRKAKVTLRHVMSHTSGLEHGMGAGAMNKAKDRLEYARTRAVTEEPGAKFSYNNEAVQLLSAVVKRASGKSVDAFVAERVFAPLGITEYTWERDGAGNVQTFYGLALGARDLAKLGALMLDGGTWQGKSVVPADWVKTSTSMAAPGSGCGLLWWLRYAEPSVVVTADKLAELDRRGLPATTKLGPLVDKPMTRVADFWLEAGARLDEADRRKLSQLGASGVNAFVDKPGAPIGFAADGWLGQQLIVLPAHHLVAVRQLRAPKDEPVDDAFNQRFGFFALVRRLARALG